ncbi:MAG: WG repeat-containing protein [Bacteroidales bacterium]
MKNIFLIAFLVIGVCRPPAQVLLKFEDKDYNCGYKTKSGDTIVVAGKYAMCITDKITETGFVLDTARGFVCIDNKGKYLYTVFNYDNGPDYISNGLYRIVEDGKIGYANNHGIIIIKPQYKCAWPFEKGMALVSYNCNIVKEGELNLWKGGDWFYIDKKGKKLDKKVESLK